ncbi:MAG: hypothetical protein ACO24H_03440 [Polynucleobacter sp.]
MSLFDITPQNTINAAHLRTALVDHREVIIRLQATFPSVYNYDEQIKELDQVLYYLDNAKTVALQVTECM